MANEIKKTVKDVGDAVKEGVHRGNADAERETRDEFGDVMTPGEKAGSIGREVSEKGKAEFDRMKRKTRDAT
ncbi:MAG: hypothetical protein JO029_16095 [Candidatus Eremiobacteraeota bacterium]|nr:hypothetical protein [Candidatus Eremiobacteraeota bacterium]MBV8435804.1 hypothetical protein [Candidatus Eremiobacteraeota bacterium]MBV8582703.1 hypothetical protein [Candidatus Eremiobacteraeota bacterium]MBV8655598.1 hypothetical protein [Candidatus Eremiobacteraeota bacterium]